MTTIEQLESIVYAHKLEDAQLHGQMLGQLGRIETHLSYLVKEQDRLQSDAEITGSHTVARIEKRADFWPKLIGGCVAGLVVAAISGLVTYLVAHR